MGGGGVGKTQECLLKSMFVTRDWVETCFPGIGRDPFLRLAVTALLLPAALPRLHLPVLLSTIHKCAHNNTHTNTITNTHTKYKIHTQILMPACCASSSTINYNDAGFQYS